MNVADLLPLLVLGSIPIAVLLQRALFCSHLVACVLNVAGYLLAGLFFAYFTPRLHPQVTPLIILDKFGCFYGALICASALSIALISYSYLKKQEGRREEYYLFLSLATFGASILTLATHFAAFFLGLETLSISLYALIGYKKTTVSAIEGALKYLVLAGVSSAFLLFGLAMLYLETGTLAIPPLAIPALSPFILAALALILVGIGFKLAVVPFYLWTPDIFQGAPAPVTAFIATISKGSVLVFLLRFVTIAGLPDLPILAAIAIASMIVGNLLALMQENVKRLLAYSSIAHLGYLLVAFIAGGSYAKVAIAFYLTAYFITTIGAFGVITILSSKDEEAELLSSFSGLAWRHPLLGGIFALMLFSLAGLPLTAGFIAKFDVLRAAIGSNLWLPVSILIITSVIGLFYYLRVIFTLFAREEREFSKTPSLSGTLTLVGLSLLLLWLGIYPKSFVTLLTSSAIAIAQGLG